MFSKVPEVPKKPAPEKKVAVAKKEVAPPEKGNFFDCGVQPVQYYCTVFLSIIHFLI